MSADPPSGKTVDHTSIEEFRSLLDLNLVNYFIFCKVSSTDILKTPYRGFSCDITATKLEV